MTGSNRYKLEQELSRLKSECEALQNAADEAEDDVMREKHLNKLDEMKRRSRHIAFKLGVYRYPEGEEVEYAPGKYMPASTYHWLID